jgi:glutathione S-transferase
MILYGFPLSPFVRKVGLALTEKGIAFDWVPTNPGQPSDEFAKASPFGKIPAIDDSGYTLSDSTAIVAYLEAKYPDKPLVPAEPEACGRAIWFEEVCDSEIVPKAVPMIVNRFLRPVIMGMEGDEEAAKVAEAAILRGFDHVEGALGADGWLDGDYSIGDLSIASVIKTLGYAKWQIDAGTHPKLAAWYARVGERPAWKWVAEHEAGVFGAMGG